jgi:hypothetical protein
MGTLVLYTIWIGDHDAIAGRRNARRPGPSDSARPIWA